MTTRRRDGRLPSVRRVVVLAVVLCFLSIHTPAATAQQRQEAAPKDLYKVLELDDTASLADVKRAYRKQALQYHPDKVAKPEEKEAAAAIFQVRG